MILVVRENLIKGLADRLLRHGKSRALSVCTVAHQRQHTFSSDLTETLQIDGISEYRCVIHLEVSGVHNNACRGVDGKRRRILNTVVRLDEFHTEAAEIDMLSVFYDLALYLGEHIVLS